VAIEDWIDPGLLASLDADDLARFEAEAEAGGFQANRYLDDEDQSKYIDFRDSWLSRNAQATQTMF
jgi:hypothetical protein